MKRKNDKGITLLALVITIIILLILAGITISTITGDDGIIKNAGQAKEETEIANEKEIVEKATVQAMGKNKYGNIEENELQSELDKETGEGKTEATDIGDEFEVIFNESNRYYTVDKDGNVGEAQDIIEDKNPGDITTGKDGETLDGSEEHPYEIWCVEDLVEWSQNYSNYMNAYINLGRTLNFNSNLSYSDGKMLECNSVEELKDLLTNTSGSGFTPIANFSGTFNGKGYEIQNIYINTVGNAGLFNIASGKIQNLRVSGNIKSTENNAGGIVGTHCSDIQDCGNEGKVSGSISAGGIIGYKYMDFSIVNCYNTGKIEGTTYAGGIIGETKAGTGNIYNCYNTGEIYSNKNSGGITGWIYYNTIAYIFNCCNVGAIAGEENVGGIIGRSGAGTGSYTQYMPIIKNAYSMPATLKGVGNFPTSEVIISETNIQNIINSLNMYINNTEDDIDKSNWKHWNKDDNDKICFITEIN